MGDSGGFGSGFEVVTARNQEERSSGLGKGSPPPSHLTKILYIPHHEEGTSHVSVAEVTAQYKESVKERGMGSASYVVALGRMPKPQAGGTEPATEENEVLYNVDFKDAALHLKSVASSSSAGSLVEANVTMESAENKAALIRLKSQEKDSVERPEDTAISMSISYPIPPISIRKRVYVYPYFAFQIPGEDKTYLEWQIHPVSQGRLRYTLVRVPQKHETVEGAAPSIPLDKDFLAVYHHVGDTVSLPLPTSEGVLLISPDMNPETEAIVVASVLGLLWQLRQISTTGIQPGADRKVSKFIKRLLHKK
ncbi:hypothetical protein PMG11_01145 [Penicillium brasilianum]|uniref:Uncharacterized protein n=1 Tax=Penicillium brasilianum TaxID=104259 RepID=A0A0F7TH67_PENBI|nr:hypothetical protein PMG11_01145 [Penicillium brasilianum]